MELYLQLREPSCPRKVKRKKVILKNRGTKYCQLIKFDGGRCVTNMFTEDTKCTAKRGRPGYEIS